MTEFSTPKPSSRANPGRRILCILVLCNALALIYLAYEARQVRAELSALQESNATMATALDLYRYERSDQYGGLGVQALISHLCKWAPKLQESDPASGSYEAIEKRVQNIVQATSILGKDAYPSLESAFLEGGPASDDAQTNDEVRKWLLRAAYTADPEQGLNLLTNAMRGTQFIVSARLRKFACWELLSLDKAAAGEVLHTILTTESASMSGTRSNNKLLGSLSKQQPGFYDFIKPFVTTGHPKTETTLLMILGRAEHDSNTKQECVKALGELKSTKAVSKIRDLYNTQPNRKPNPIFRRHCIEALAKIQGSEACEFLQEASLKESDQGLNRRIQELLRALCK